MEDDDVAMDVGDEDASSDDATLDGPDVAAAMEAVEDRILQRAAMTTGRPVELHTQSATNPVRVFAAGGQGSDDHVPNLALVCLLRVDDDDDDDHDPMYHIRPALAFVRCPHGTVSCHHCLLVNLALPQRASAPTPSVVSVPVKSPLQKYESSNIVGRNEIMKFHFYHQSIFGDSAFYRGVFSFCIS
jgi:hypothetical protein